MIPVSRAECFAPGELPTPENPYKQRWYYELESKIAVRLERGPHGEALYRFNDTSIKGAERDRDRKAERECSYEDCIHRLRFHDPDMSHRDDVAAIAEERAMLTALFDALDALTPEYRELWDMLIDKTRKNVIAGKFGLTLDGVRCREQKLFEILRSDTALKGFIVNI